MEKNREKQKEEYVYPARVVCSEGTYRLEFLDFPNLYIAEEETKEKAIRSAQQYLALEILDRENGNGEKEIPEPNWEQQDVIYVHIWMPYYRRAVKEKYIKKNVTIPQSLDILAKSAKVNYSAALVEGIKLELSKLGIEY